MTYAFVYFFLGDHSIPGSLGGGSLQEQSRRRKMVDIKAEGTPPVRRHNPRAVKEAEALALAEPHQFPTIYILGLIESRSGEYVW
jgi:hypothetical protein